VGPCPTTMSNNILDELEAFEAEIASLDPRKVKASKGGWEHEAPPAEETPAPPSNVVLSYSSGAVLDKQPAGPLPKSAKPRAQTKFKIKTKAPTAKLKTQGGASKKNKSEKSQGNTSSTNSSTSAPSDIPLYTLPQQPQILITNPNPPTPTVPKRAAPKKEKKIYHRVAASKIWEDKTLADWPEEDYRIFCGDLGNEVNDNTLAKAFVKYPSFAKAKVIRDKRTQKTKGFGFVSFLDPFDCAKALKDMNGKYIGNRPVKLRKSVWERRSLRGKLRKRKRGNSANSLLPKMKGGPPVEIPLSKEEQEIEEALSANNPSRGEEDD